MKAGELKGATPGSAANPKFVSKQIFGQKKASRYSRSIPGKERGCFVFGASSPQVGDRSMGNKEGFVCCNFTHGPLVKRLAE